VDVRGWVAAVYGSSREIGSRYGRHADSQLAAGIAYRVLFSLVPLVALVVSLLDRLLPSELRRDMVDWLFHRLPGSTLKSAVNQSLSHPGTAAPVVAVIALAGLLWAASGMMASIRTAFRVIWEVPGPTYVRGKLRDLLLVTLAGGLILAAFAASLIAQVIAQAGKGLSDALGLEGAAAAAGTVVEVAGGLMVGFVALAILYLVVPPIKVQLGAVWPSAALAALAIEVLSRGFAIYTTKTGLNHIYGPFGVVFTFLLLLYLLATILLLGAELTAIRGHTAPKRPQHKERDRAASA
jgi:membrane protein